jgi:hypothetical protein
MTLMRGLRSECGEADVDREGMFGEDWGFRWKVLAWDMARLFGAILGNANMSDS